MDAELERQSELLMAAKGKHGGKKPKVAKSGIMFDSANHELEKKKKTNDEPGSVPNKEDSLN